MIELRNASLSDLNIIVNLHRDAYPDYLFTSRFTFEMLSSFYREQIQHADSNFVVTLNGFDVGVIMGSRRSSNARKAFIRENIGGLAVTLIKNPRFLLKKIGGIIKAKENFNSRYETRLLNILISEKILSNLIKDQGINAPDNLASFAMELFENDLREKKVYSYGLSVDKLNLKALNFYLKIGFRVERIIGDSVFMYKKLKEPIE